MLTAKKLMVFSSEEVRSEAVQMLIKRMGITNKVVEAGPSQYCLRSLRLECSGW